MSTDKVKKIKRLRELKGDRDLAILKMLGEIKQEIKDEFKEEFKAEAERLALDTIKEQISSEKGILSLLRGAKGDKGDTPRAGKDFPIPQNGKTPVKGIDFFTSKDKDTFAKKVKDMVMGMITLPRNGKDGRNGRDGVDGKPGDNGLDGSPDTPEQIVDKLNTLKGVLNIDVLNGLDKLINQITRNVKSSVKGSTGGGGGMGNTVHKTFNVGSSTTSSTLDSEVAASGNAIWIYYQGQHLVKDTHYTISGKTITWLETFSDSTFIDVTYIRT